MRRYGVFALSVLVLYTMAGWWGWGLSASKRGKIPDDVRHGPGGYRSFAYWRGGK
jgi:hypothetical protein